MERIYKPKVLGRILILLMMPVLVGAGMMKGSQNNLSDLLKNPVALMALFATAIVIGITIFAIVTEEIRISEDGITRHTLFGTRRLPTGEIGGWRVRWHSTRGGAYYTLEICPKDKTTYGPIKISQYIKIDGDFKSWVMKFPNLTTYGGLLGTLMDSPRFKEKIDSAKDPQIAVKIDGLAKLGFGNMDITPEKMVENYFAQWGL